MSIQFRCDQCDREYDLPEMAAGKKAKCECGVLLVVPTETPSADQAETFDPAEPSEIGSRPKPKPPRTLAAAVRQAAPPPPVVEEPVPVPDPVVPIEPPPPPAPPSSAAPSSAAPSSAVAPDMPPPLPPTYQASAEPVSPSRPVEKRYRNLRAYCGWLRLIGWLALAMTALSALGVVGILVSQIDTILTNPLAFVAMLVPNLFTLVGGVWFFVVVNAAAELCLVFMDIEENTRRR